MSESSTRIAALLTETTHRTQYAAIDPTNPLNSAVGKTVVVSGGTTGIGYAIARAFAQAEAANVVLIARRQEALDEGSASLRAELAQAGLNADVWTYLLDIRDAARAEVVFEEIRKRLSADGQARDADILVTSAARGDQGQSTLEFDPQTLRDGYETNVLGNLNLVRAFLRPEIPAIPLAPLVGPVKDTAGVQAPNRQKIILDVSSIASYLKFPGHAAYGPTKLAFTQTMQYLQAEVNQLPGSPVRIHSFHPGVILSPGSRNLGFTEDFGAWDDESLPGGFAVWLASPAAEFLKGRFVCANWDVDRLLANKQVFQEDPELCQYVLKF
ncbi:Short-chain dehydrogenase/reductase SDR [Macrophomina phaseolina MS6]|uniref:Short-chain dehydrogenase/reductase SDR n=1 Tax=Macrophomina phaseolina (strain MS6) TaxID=1126212 RepID=K2RG74_MACPH|nr:Short-chain dehydrogenase/reductase SDR [Macrophomina phaseolina MS6]